MLDYLWAGLPILSTEGDSMADLVEKKGLGICCGYQSVEDWLEAFQKMANDDLFRGGCRESVSLARNDFRWKNSVAPLIEALRAPARIRELNRPFSWLFHEPFASLAKASLSLKEEGIAGFMERFQRKIARKRNES
ncbi:MAG TPA: hypothetical protein DD435_06380 [Cyanobacteria bacterium UBA8530]|nr:hypothetical protein [Cyanobacteria bacterium UBA8530]